MGSPTANTMITNTEEDFFLGEGFVQGLVIVPNDGASNLTHSNEEEIVSQSCWWLITEQPALAAGLLRIKSKQESWPCFWKQDAKRAFLGFSRLWLHLQNIPNLVCAFPEVVLIWLNRIVVPPKKTGGVLLALSCCLFLSLIFFFFCEKEG